MSQSRGIPKYKPCQICQTICSRMKGPTLIGKSVLVIYSSLWKNIFHPPTWHNHLCWCLQKSIEQHILWPQAVSWHFWHMKMVGCVECFGNITPSPNKTSKCVKFRRHSETAPESRSQKRMAGACNSFWEAFGRKSSYTTCIRIFESLDKWWAPTASSTWSFFPWTGILGRHCGGKGGATSTCFGSSMSFGAAANCVAQGASVMNSMLLMCAKGTVAA